MLTSLDSFYGSFILGSGSVFKRAYPVSTFVIHQIPEGLSNDFVSVVTAWEKDPQAFHCAAERTSGNHLLIEIGGG